MDTSSPTTLIVPTEQPDASGPMQGFSTILGIGTGMVMICVMVALVHRRRQVDRGEQAFRHLSRTLGLTHHQIRQIRQYAAGRGLSSPVGIVLSPALTAQALEPSRD